MGTMVSERALVSSNLTKCTNSLSMTPTLPVTEDHSIDPCRQVANTLDHTRHVSNCVPSGQAGAPTKEVSKDLVPALMIDHFGHGHQTMPPDC